MSGSFGTLQRTLIGSNLNVNGRYGIDSTGDLKVHNGLVRNNLRVVKNLSVGGSNTVNGDLTVNGNLISTDTSIDNLNVTHLNVNANTNVNLLTVNGQSTLYNNVTINGTLDLSGTTLISNNIDDTYSLVKVFEGTTVNIGDQVEHILYNQPNHARSIVELKIFIHDVNSNTFWRYSDGKYMWYREWTNDAQEVVIGTPIDIGSGSPLEYVIDRFQVDNNITVRITQNTSIATNSNYKIIAKIIQN